MLEDDPKMVPRSLGFFSEWVVEVTWPSGHKDTVQSFKSEAHALGWIKHESAAWIGKARGPRR
jgi:hypothetical protein